MKNPHPLSWFLGGVIAIAMSQLPTWAPEWTTVWLCRPAGVLASLLLGVDTSVIEGLLHLHHASGLVSVSVHCSGAGFLGMVLGLLVVTGWKAFPRSLFCAFLPAVYILCIGINAIRISASTTLGALSAPFLDAMAQSHAHLLTGICTFLPALIGLYMLSNRITENLQVS